MVFIPVALYSYICVTSQNLCLGASPGQVVPLWNPSSPFLLQLKDIARNQAKSTDYFKLRFAASDNTTSVFFPTPCGRN